MSKKRIFEVIQIGNNEDIPSRLFDIFISVTIILNVVTLFLETFEKMEPYYDLFHIAEIITMGIFLAEYILRIWTAEFLYPQYSRRRAVWRFLISYDGIVDLLTILPFFFLSGFVVFRILRVVRIFHLFRINSQYDSFHVITTVLNEKKDQIVSSVFIVLVLMLASSLCMYSAEHEAQPEQFQNAFSGVWWSISTLLTIGYGDIYPTTLLGKFMGGVVGLLGVGFVAIPTGIISAGFVEQYTKLKTMSAYAEEMDVRFVSLFIDEKHAWKDMAVKNLLIPSGLILAIIIRDKDTVIPKGDTVIRHGDRLVLGAEVFRYEHEIKLREIIVKENHDWIGRQIKDLDISRQTLIVMIKRKNRVIIPEGSTVIKQGDSIILYSKNNIKESKMISVEY